MTAARVLPAWAEDVLRRFGPQPAYGEAVADPAALARYAAVTERFRRRWDPELTTEVWPLFFRKGAEHALAARHLLGAMIDMARYGSRTEMAAKREALEDVARQESALRQLVETLRVKIAARAFLTHEHLIEGGLEDDLLAKLDRAAASVESQSWRAPRLFNSDYTEAINSRKSDSDALNAMLLALEHIKPLLLPVKLTNKACASIFNVAHDVDGAEAYGEPNVKTARARLRRK